MEPPSPQLFSFFTASPLSSLLRPQLNDTLTSTSCLVSIGSTQILPRVCRRGHIFGTSFLFPPLPPSIDCRPIRRSRHCCFPHHWCCHHHIASFSASSAPPPSLQIPHQPPYDQFHVINYPRKGTMVGPSFLFTPLPPPVEFFPSQDPHHQNFQ